MRPWPALLWILLSAVFCTGGTFTCSTHDDDDKPPATRPVRAD